MSRAQPEPATLPEARQVGPTPGTGSSGTGRRRDVSLWDALRAEWTKLRTTPGTFWLLAAVIAATVGVSAAAAAATHCPAYLTCQEDTGKLTLTGVQLGQAVVAILAVLAIGGEYTTGMIRTTFAAMPHRGTVLAAKAAIVAGLALAAGIVAVAGSLLAGALILPGHGFTQARGFPALSLADPPVLRAAVGSVLYLALIALLALGVAAAVRDSAVAVGVVLSLLYLFPIVAGVAVSPHWQRHLEQAGPTTAGLAVAATRDLASQPIGPWAGLGVLAAWAAAALLVGAVLLSRRDA